MRGDDAYNILNKKIKNQSERIKETVNEYLKENPVQSGATEEQAQQIKQNTDDVASLKEDLEKTYIHRNLYLDTITEEVINQFQTELPEGWKEVLLIVKYPTIGDDYVGESSRKPVTICAGSKTDPYDLFTYFASSSEPTYKGRFLFFEFLIVKRGNFCEISRLRKGFYAEAIQNNPCFLDIFAEYEKINLISFNSNSIPIGTQFYVYVN